MKGVKIKFNTMSTKYVYTFGDGKAEGKADMKICWAAKAPT